MYTDAIPYIAELATAQAKHAREMGTDCALFELLLSNNRLTNRGLEDLFTAIEGVCMHVCVCMSVCMYLCT